MFCACLHAVCYAPSERPPSENAMTDSKDPTASVMLDTTEKMIDVWMRLSPEKQAALLKRFGTQENALAALVTTKLLAPGKI
ncbi:MAG: hypothetical protein JWP80_1344 [Pseudomonas sp.]|nr:hypothetical protein [Pseudomonas sp.]